MITIEIKLNTISKRSITICTSGRPKKINKTYKHEFTRLHKTCTCIHIQNIYKYMAYTDRYTAALHICHKENNVIILVIG